MESRSGSTLLYIQVKHWIGSKATSKSKVLYTFTRTNVVIFGAGGVLRSWSRYYLLDETAVFGAVCRHDFPLGMLSLKHGERYTSICEIVHVHMCTLIYF